MRGRLTRCTVVRPAMPPLGLLSHSPWRSSFARSGVGRTEEVAVGRMLGAGAFGAVYDGEWMHVAVAVKQLHVTSLMGEAEEEFKREMSLMAVRRAATAAATLRSRTPRQSPSSRRHPARHRV